MPTPRKRPLITSREYQPQVDSSPGIAQRRLLLMPWTEFARCRGTELNTFFVDDLKTEKKADKLQRLEKARQYCRNCAAIEQCGNHALRIENRGIWAGHEIENLKARFRWPVSYEEVRHSLDPPEPEGP